MPVPIIRNELHFSRVAELTITIERYTPLAVPNPTKREMDACPASFRCYSCLVRKGKNHFGGTILEKRICTTCYPYLSEADVGAMIVFDMWHGFKVD